MRSSPSKASGWLPDVENSRSLSQIERSINGSEKGTLNILSEGYLKETKMKYKRFKDLTERKSRIQGFTTAAARLWQMKLKTKLTSLGNEIRNSKDLGNKIDLLSKQNQVTGAMVLVGTNQGADGVISKGAIVMSMITEEELEECLR